MGLKRLFFAATAACALAVPAVVTNVIDVAEGQTATLSLPGTPADGDWVVKTGKGTLNAVSAYKAVKLNFHIKEGVYFVPASCGAPVHKGDNSSLIIEDGATVNIDASTAHTQFNGWWDISFSGHGAGTGNNLGAICIGGGQMNPTLSLSGRFTMKGDATIYSYGSMNAVLSGAGANAGPNLIMDGHMLTVRGKSSSSVFRPRWKLSVTKPGPIVLRNGQFARHDTVNDIPTEIPLVKVTEGGMLAAYDNGRIWSQVRAFEFDAGCSLGKGNGSPKMATLTMKKVTGPATVANTLLTVSEELVVRGTDLVDAHCLTAADTLTFASGCKLSVTDWGALSFTPGARHVVAAAPTIAGTPALTGAAADLFTLENTGTELALVAKASNKVPQLLEGEENAAHNSAVMATVALADSDVFCFPAGEYHFSGPIDFSASTAKNVALSCLAEAPCVLHAGLVLGAMEQVMVRNLTFKGFDTPAVVATGTAGLTIEGCTLTSVKGVYGESGRFPYALVNVTDLRVLAPTYTPDDRDAEPTLWDAPAFLDGGTQTPDSLVRAGEVVFHTPDGVNKDNWWGWDQVTNRAHLVAGAYSGRTIRKTGPATLDIGAEIAAAGVAGIEVAQGQYVARSDTALGKAKADVHVSPGAALTLAGSNKAVNGRKVVFSGTGINGVKPAIRFTGSSVWDKTQYVNWTLEDDATMYNNCSGECGTFLWGKANLNGHVLTLKGVAASNYRFGRSFEWHGGGTLVVNGVTLSASSGTATAYVARDGVDPAFLFVNGAKFVPDNADIFNLVKVADFAAGTALAPKNTTACTFVRLTGPVDASSDKVDGLTVSQSYTARAADLLAKKAMSVHGTLTFGANATVEVDDVAALERTSYAFAAADAFTGKPKASAALAAAGFAVSRRDGTLLLGPPQGSLVVVR